MTMRELTALAACLQILLSGQATAQENRVDVFPKNLHAFACEEEGKPETGGMVFFWPDPASPEHFRSTMVEGVLFTEEGGVFSARSASTFWQVGNGTAIMVDAGAVEHVDCRSMTRDFALLERLWAQDGTAAHLQAKRDSAGKDAVARAEAARNRARVALIETRRELQSAKARIEELERRLAE